MSLVFHVVVVGPMGVGKSTIGSAVAVQLGVAWSDSDVDITKSTGLSGREIAAERGVADLHRLEAEVLLAALAEPAHVVTAAASVADSERCRAALESAYVVMLDAPTTEIIGRSARGIHRRDVDDLVELIDRRRSQLRTLADVTIDAGRPPMQVVASVLEAVREPDDLV